MSHREDHPRNFPVGTTVVFYDPKIDAWRCVSVSPMQGAIRMFLARKIGDEIALDGVTDEGHPEHWVFSESKSRSFRWRAVTSHDQGKTWQLTEEMRVRRTNANR